MSKVNRNLELLLSLPPGNPVNSKKALAEDLYGDLKMEIRNNRLNSTITYLRDLGWVVNMDDLNRPSLDPDQYKILLRWTKTFHKFQTYWKQNLTMTPDNMLRQSESREAFNCIGISK